MPSDDWNIDDLDDVVADMDNSQPTADQQPSEPEVAKMSDMTPLHQWSPDDYAPFVTGKSAKKLASSSVAPLVAAARGDMRSITDEGDLDELPKKLGLRRNTKQWKTIETSVFNDDGVLLMPWFAVSDVARSAESRTFDPPVASWQFRPTKPAEENGRPRKYEFASKSQTVIGAHPCTPPGWLTDIDGPPILLAEGMLKADAALTAMLISSGVTPDRLGLLDEDGDPRTDIETIRRKLYRMVTEIHEAQRVCVLALAGVANWHSNPEWNTMPSRREWWIGFDGDVATNPNVWRQANRLWQLLEQSKKGKVKLLSPTAVGDGGAVGKIGIDDYLNSVGTWPELLKSLTNALPKAPEASAAPGEWRVSPDGCSCQEAVAERDTDGKPTGVVHWQNVFPVAGRIKTTTTRRVADMTDIEAGVIDLAAHNSGLDAGCEVEVSWNDQVTGEKKTALITGPANLLATSPDQWSRPTSKVDVPPDVLRIPQWPPSGQIAQKWMTAIKRHRADEQESVIAYRHMGWAPISDDPNKPPVFLAGDQIVGDPDEPEQAAITIDTDDVRTGIDQVTRFGVGAGDDPNIIPSWGDPEYLASVQRDLIAVLDNYVLIKPWRRRRDAATTIAFGLRPVVPVRTKAVWWLYGPPRAGKTWTAEKAMAFWEHKPGEWYGRLPGSANSTFASIEHSVATSMIWIADDLAPTPNKHATEDQETTIGRVIRMVHEGVGRGRSRLGGGNQQTKSARGVFAVTSEQAPSIMSITSRCVVSEFRTGHSLSADDSAVRQMNDFVKNSGAPSRLTEAMIVWWRHQAKQRGWKTMVEAYKQRREALSNEVKQTLTSARLTDTTRPSDMVADLMLSFEALRDMAEDLEELPEQYTELLEPSQLQAELVQAMVHSIQLVNNSTPGRALLLALRSLLATNRDAHIGNSTAPDVPPSIPGRDRVWHQLGWQRASDEMVKPVGEKIGDLYDYDGTPVILFDTVNAYNLAKRKYPDLVRHDAVTSLGAMWDEGIIPTEKSQRDGVHPVRPVTFQRKAGKGASIRLPEAAAKNRPSGIPVLLDDLLN